MNRRELEAWQEEVDRNWEAFRLLLPALMECNPGRLAVMRQGALVMCFDACRGALEVGRAMFEGAPYSVQEITTAPLDFGRIA